jgi:hypothetical protein
MQVGIADDRILLSKPREAPAAVAAWKALGIDTVRVHVRWYGIAPAKNRKRPPKGFRGQNPNDPHYHWNYLDRAIDLLVANDLKPILAVTGSGPLWSSRDPSRGSPRYKPDPVAFARFATAVAKRYGDHVTRYIVYNEPNQPGWLQPQFECPRKGRCYPMAPHLYRELVRAAYPAIKRVDPASQVLVGALAPRGGPPTRRNRPMRPLPFIRAFGCLNERYQRIKTGLCRHFKPARMDGFSYHPHGVFRSPVEPNPNPDEAAIADLPRLKAVLDRVQRLGGFRTPGGRPVGLHLTEFGYQTRPPDPYSGITLAEQKAWIQQASYVAWADPRVRSLVQYEWEDEPASGSGRRAFSNWQSGLHYASGRPKPALSAFANPFFADSRAGGPRVRFWGQVRPGGKSTVSLLRRQPGTTDFSVVTRVSTDSYGFWSLRLPVAEATDWRYAYETVPAAAGDAGGNREPESPRRVLSAVQRVTPPASLRSSAAKRAKR